MEASTIEIERVTTPEETEEQSNSAVFDEIGALKKFMDGRRNEIIGHERFTDEPTGQSRPKTTREITLRDTKGNADIQFEGAEKRLNGLIDRELLGLDVEVPEFTGHLAVEAAREEAVEMVTVRSYSVGENSAYSSF